MVLVGGHEVLHAVLLESVGVFGAALVGFLAVPGVLCGEYVVLVLAEPLVHLVEVGYQRLTGVSIVVVLDVDVVALVEIAAGAQVGEGYRLFGFGELYRNAVGELLAEPSYKPAGVDVVIEELENIL